MKSIIVLLAGAALTQALPPLGRLTPDKKPDIDRRINLINNTFADASFAPTAYREEGTNEVVYYKFSNIPYASLSLRSRFERPRDPRGTTIGTPISANERLAWTRPVICPQAQPAWRALPSMALDKKILTPSPRESENCLALDVSVPAAMLDQVRGIRPNGSGNSTTTTIPRPLPVAVWFHDGQCVEQNPPPWVPRGPAGGGGCVRGPLARIVSGSKNDLDTDNLIQESTRMSDFSPGFIVVTFNYRLGMFGWLPIEQGDKVSNAGLWDQRRALQWVQRHISKFGGDPNRVTVIGEGAGAASIMHHITGFGGVGDHLFARAVILNPNWEKSPERDVTKLTLEAAASVTGRSIKNVSDLDSLGTKELQELNRKIVGDSHIGGYTFGPVRDHAIVASSPLSVLRDYIKRRKEDWSGNFDDRDPRQVTKLEILVGNDRTAKELGYSKRWTRAKRLAHHMFPEMSGRSIDRVRKTLYPFKMNEKKYGYASKNDRADRIANDALVACNAYAVAKGLRDNTYKFTINASSTPYQFYPLEGQGRPSGLPISNMSSPTLYILGFIVNGGPRGLEDDGWHHYGDTREQMVFGPGLIPQVEAVGRRDRHRCDWWMRMKGAPRKDRHAHGVFNRLREDLHHRSSSELNELGAMIGLTVVTVILLCLLA